MTSSQIRGLGPGVLHDRVRAGRRLRGRDHALEGVDEHVHGDEVEAPDSTMVLASVLLSAWLTRVMIVSVLVDLTISMAVCQ